MSITLRRNALIIAVLIAVVLILWLPFGFNVGFQLDGWVFYDKLNAARLMGAVPPAPLSRPALNLAWMAAYAIDPNSYTGANVMMIALIIGKGLLCAAILHNLTKKHALALGFGALAVLLPADTGIFYLGALGLHLNLFSWLLASLCILIFYETLRLPVAILVILSLLIGTLGYEIVFMLIPVGLLALLAKARRVDRRFLVAAGLYLIVPLITGARYAMLWLSRSEGMGYQNSLIDRTVTAGDMLGSLVGIYGRHFVGGWFGEGNAAYLPYAIAAGVIVGLAGWWMLRRGGQKFTASSTMNIQPGGLIVGGLLTIALGVALYLPTTERDNTIRTYYYSSIGAALALSVAGWEIARRMQRGTIFAVFIGVLAGMGCWRLLEDHAAYRDMAVTQQRILRQMVEQMGQVETPVSALVIDTTEEKTLDSLFHGSLYLRAAVSLIYDTVQIGLGICDDEDMGGSGFVRCEFGEAFAAQYRGDEPYVQSTYDRLIVLRYDGNDVELVTSLAEWVDTPVPYAPTNLISAGEPARAGTMLAG